MEKKEIIQKLRVLENKLEKTYHLSYDTKNGINDFKDHDEARKYILCVLANTNFWKIASYNKSCLIIRYKKDEHIKLFAYLDKHLKPFFHYSLSMVAKDQDSNSIMQHNVNNELNNNLEIELKTLTCDNFNKKIAQY